MNIFRNFVGTWVMLLLELHPLSNSIGILLRCYGKLIDEIAALLLHRLHKRKKSLPFAHTALWHKGNRSLSGDPCCFLQNLTKSLRRFPFEYRHDKTANENKIACRKPAKGIRSIREHPHRCALLLQSPLQPMGNTFNDLFLC